ncbi:MAG TPA: ABC transporter substrate-binding protein [Holophagaceae bacterium]|nr:ABC transporter substrate-binding protein [Holophagaceae bacterium]
MGWHRSWPLEFSPSGAGDDPQWKGFTLGVELDDLQRTPLHRRSFISCLGAVAASFGGMGCRRGRELVVGIHPWIGYETLYLARGFKWLPPTVRFHEGGSVSDLMAPLRAGTLDAACLTLDETLRARAEGLPLKVVLVFDASAGADAVLARPGIRKLADLRGKRLGVERNALGALMLAKVLESSGLEASDLILVEIPIEQHVAAWRRNDLDAVITFEPTSTFLLREGAHVIFDSRQVPETVFDVLAVRADRIPDRRSALGALVAGHFRGLAHLQTNRQDSIYRIAARQGVTPEEVQRALSGILLPSLPGNRAYLASPDSRLLAAARTVSGILVKSGDLKREASLEGLVDPTWLPRDGG